MLVVRQDAKLTAGQAGKPDAGQAGKLLALQECEPVGVQAAKTSAGEPGTPGMPGSGQAEELMTERKLEMGAGCPGMPGSGQAVDLMTERKLKMLAGLPGRLGMPGFSGTRRIKELFDVPVGKLVAGLSVEEPAGQGGRLAARLPGSRTCGCGWQVGGCRSPTLSCRR